MQHLCVLGNEGMYLNAYVLLFIIPRELFETWVQHGLQIQLSSSPTLLPFPLIINISFKLGCIWFLYWNSICLWIFVYCLAKSGIFSSSLLSRLSLFLSQFAISQPQRHRPLEHAITLMSPVTGVLYYMLLPCLVVFVFIICQMCNEITIWLIFINIYFYKLAISLVKTRTSFISLIIFPPPIILRM